MRRQPKRVELGGTRTFTVPDSGGGILNALNLFCIRTEMGVFPVYVRSEHNIADDGLTRWPHTDLNDWASHEGMTQIDGASRLWAGMGLSYNPDADGESPPNTFALLGYVLHFLRSYNYRVCEWRPSHFAGADILENWGVPVFSDQIPDVAARDILVRRSSHPLSPIGDKDIVILIGYCSSWSEIMDFRRTVATKSSRYAAMIAPGCLRGGADSTFWTSQTTIDTALTGDPRASAWTVYCAGGNNESHV